MRLNLTQHASTPEQGCLDLRGEQLSQLRTLLNFVVLPSRAEIEERAKAIAEMAIATGATSAMIGGAPFLMPALEKALAKVNVTPLYAFSVREVVETTSPDGGVIKTAIFRHLGFVEA